MEETESIYRFMHFEHLLDLLKNHRIPLISPSVWEDRNDAFATELSCSKNEVVRICCFTLSNANSIYRWSKMAPNNLCVRVEFDRKKLEACLPENMKFCEVKYKSAKNLEYDQLETIDECAYIKSKPFSIEKEIRLIMHSSKKQYPSEKHVCYLKKIPDDSIKNICFSPFLEKEYVVLIKKFLKNYLGDQNHRIKITRAVILDAPKWKSALFNAVENLRKKSAGKNID